MSEHGTTAGDWTFGLTVPEHWITVDVADVAGDPNRSGDAPESELRAQIAAGVDAYVDDQPDLGPAAAWMNDVAGTVIIDAVDRGALAAAVGFETVAGEIAPLAVVVQGLAGDQPPDVDSLADALRVARPEDINGRDVSVVDLPGGPAVRVHAISEGAPGDEGEIVVVEGVDHFIPVPGGTDLLLLSGTTPAVGVGDALLPLFDDIATTVEIRTT